jgi:hypothetical protein
MALPTLTPEQRKAALEKATQVRRARSDLLAALKTGRVTLNDLLAKADAGDEMVTKTRVAQVVKALPGVGEKRAQQLLEQAEIADGRKIGGLGPNQRTTLLAAVNPA